MSDQREEPVSLELEAIARKYWDREIDDHSFTSWGAMLTAVKEAHELGAKSRSPEGMDISGLLHAARNAESKLRYMGAQFNSPNFTDRYGDGPIMLSMADALKEEIKRATMNVSPFTCSYCGVVTEHHYDCPKRSTPQIGESKC